MRVGLVVIRMIYSKGGAFYEYDTVTDKVVDNFDREVKEGRIKEFKSKDEAEAFKKKVGFKKPIKNMWDVAGESTQESDVLTEEQEAEIKSLMKNTLNELREMANDKFGSYEESDEKRDLAIKLLGIY